MKLNGKKTLLPERSQETRRTQKLLELNGAAIAISSALDLEQTLACAAGEACRITEFERSLILLLDESGRYLHLSSASTPASHLGPAGRDGATFFERNGDIAALLQMEKPVYVGIERVPQPLRLLLADPSGTSSHVLLVPLVIEGASLGLIVLGDQLEDGVPTAFDLDVAALLGSHVAVAIRSAQSVMKVNHQLFETVGRGKREWELTFDSISDGIFICNSEYVVIRANKAFAATFGKHPRDIIGQKCYETVWGYRRPCEQCLRKSLRAEPDEGLSAASMKCVIQGMTSQVTAYPMQDHEGKLTAVVHVVKDVTEQIRIQELIIRSAKLRAVGEMASGIAHDFNNLLASIIGWSEIMVLADLPPRLQECARAIHQAAIDGTETVKRIQEYTRIRKDTEFTSVDVNEIVRGAVELARPRWKGWAEKSGIAINVSTDLADVSPAKGNASDLREVFLNILLNAIDAMPGGGEITIRTGQRGQNVFAAITDSGIGMSEDVQKRIFDPFFTTKGAAGSGLGLSVAYGIVSRHGGELTVQSEPEKGSTFTVSLPVASVVEHEPEPQMSCPSRKVRILLVDDDERVLRAIEAMLQAEGHSVTKCLGGKQGISLLGEGAYDLIITDLGMPEVNGWEVAAKARQIAPATPVILLTGWGAEISAERLEKLGIDGIMQKPCRLADLRQIIDQVLTRDRPQLNALPPAESNSKPSVRLNILVIEDNKWFGQALKQRLELDGHLVFLAASGHEGLLAFEEQDFDLVLSDLKLPDESGLEVAGRLKCVRQQPFVAIMTGDISAIDSSLLQGEGVDAVLPKPWKEPELRHVLDKALERRYGI